MTHMEGMQSAGWIIYGIVTASLAGLLLVVGAGTGSDSVVPAEAGENPAMCSPYNITAEPLFGSLPEPRSPYMQGSVWEGVPAVNVSINQNGLRDKPFNQTPPQGTVRILVIGDSFTYGYGLNASQRFTDIVEKRLNSRFNKRVQVITAGHPGWGMRNYYQYLYNYGQHYQPDLVVISFYNLDSISMERNNRWENEVIAEYNLSAEKWYTHDAAKQAHKERTVSFLQNLTWNTSEIRIYGNRMQALAEERPFDLIFFNIQPRTYHGDDYRFQLINSTGEKTVLSKWSEVCDTSLLQAPGKLTDLEQYTFPGDGHYNAAGNKVLAKTLYPVLERHVSEGIRR